MVSNSMSHLPTISIVTCSLNTDPALFQKTLTALHLQRYPKKKIEHLIMDGGSQRELLEPLITYGATIVVRKDLRDKALVRMKLGITKAKGDIILFLEPDNIILDKDWLQKMVKPFQDNSQIIGTLSMYNTYEKNMPLLTKYSALIGTNNPIIYYLGKSEKMPLFKKRYDIGEVIDENDIYYTVSFDATNLPTLGDNGHMVRRKVILPEVKKMEEFYHTDAFFNLLNKGQNTYGIVKNAIIHYTGSDIISFLTRRTLYKSQYFDNKTSVRTYLVFNKASKKDLWNLFKFIFYSLTFFQTIYVSLKGFIMVREAAWFLHPIICFLLVFFYADSELKHFYNKNY